MKNRLISFILAFTVLLVFQAVPVYGAQAGSAALDTEAPKTVCEADILIDSQSGQVLYEKNADKLLTPASMTKMMTALLTIEHYKGDLDHKITVPKEAVGITGNSLNIKEGEVFTVKQLLYGLMLHSSNDVAVCLAINVGGSVSGFADMMNARAKKVGAVHTHFINPNGLTDSHTHLTTARDMSKTATECMKNSTFRKIVGTSTYTIPATNKSKERHVKSTNMLLRGKKFKVKVNGETRYAKYKYATGIKTGLMNEAGYCFCGSATKNGTKLISVSMKGAEDQDRFADAISMFEYGFNNFHTEELIAKGASAGHVWIKYGHFTRVDTVVTDGAYVTLTSNEASDMATKKIVMKKGLTAPLSKGTKVGTVKLYENGEKVGTADVVLSKSVKKGGPWTAIYISDWTFIGGIIIIILFLILFIYFRKRGKRRRRKRDERMARMREERALEIAKERARSAKRSSDRDWPF